MTIPDEFPKHRRYWWRYMGLTRTHFVGVFLVESALVAIAMVLMAGAFENFFADPIFCIYMAICILLLQIGVLLSSILSLLFYLCGWIQNLTNDNTGGIE